MRPDTPSDERTATLEAFADTLIPGAKRFPGDKAVAGAATDDGAVAAGALELLEWPACGVDGALDDFARDLNKHARAYAARHGLTLEEGTPPFVALSFEHRTALVAELTAADHPERELWVLLAIFSYMAYDAAAHLHTRDAIAAGHPGLTAMGMTPPGPDGLWRHPAHSYGRPLARLHPDTTPTGSLA